MLQALIEFFAGFGSLDSKPFFIEQPHRFRPNLFRSQFTGE